VHLPIAVLSRNFDVYRGVFSGLGDISSPDATPVWQILPYSLGGVWPVSAWAFEAALCEPIPKPFKLVERADLPDPRITAFRQFLEHPANIVGAWGGARPWLRRWCRICFPGVVDGLDLRVLVATGAGVVDASCVLECETIDAFGGCGGLGPGLAGPPETRPRGLVRGR
jgi:hypothetical protein